tara:strand:- start:679 stop:1044 length:366 start_codon:yes stop_codon:yes gene_type:complete
MSWEDIIKIGYIPSDARKRSAPTINWLDAFDKFGFDDGAENKGQTEDIVDFLEDNKYKSHLTYAGGHNTYISRIEDFDGEKVYPIEGESSRYGKRRFFPPKLLKLLDGKYGKSTKSEHIKS